MSFSFDGRIREYPFLVDCFNRHAEAYFLTHSHTDHLKGILDKSFIGKIYCTKITRDILDLKYTEVAKYLVVKNFNEPFQIDSSIGKVRVTLIESYHCPGSTMFLFEGTKFVLVTGDIRAEDWWINQLEKNLYLFPYIKLKQLDNIYLDTTFTYRGEPYIDIMSNSEGILTLIEFLKLYPRDVKFLFVDSVSGSEEVWSTCVEYFNGILIPDDEIRKRLEITNFNFGTGDMKFYVGKHNQNFVTIKHRINLNIIDYAANCLPKKALNYDVIETYQSHSVVKHEGKMWILPRDGDELLPTNISLMFSRHSSYQESKKFVDLFSPKSIYPCTSSKQAWENGFSIKRAFGGSNHDYDNEMQHIYGNSSVAHSVKCINRWSFSQCLQETEFKGIDYKSKKINIQSVITGRGEHKFNAIINLHQNLNIHYSTSDYESESDEPLPSIVESSYIEQSLNEVYLSQISTTRIQSISSSLDQDPRNWFSYRFNTH